MTKDQILEIARKWGMFAAGLPQIEGFALDVIAASACGSAEPVAWVYCDTLHAEHCHLSDQEAINDGWLPLVYARHAGFAREDIRELAVKCGFKYWRASDAHGVTSSIAEAESLLADLLGVEVEIGGGKAAIADTAGAKPVAYALASDLDSLGNPRIAGKGCFLNKEPREGFVPIYRAALASPAIDTAPYNSQAVALISEEPIGEVRENGVTWFKQNPHAFPEGTKFYAKPDAVLHVTASPHAIAAFKRAVIDATPSAENRPAIDAAGANTR